LSSRGGAGGDLDDGRAVCRGQRLHAGDVGDVRQPGVQGAQRGRIGRGAGLGDQQQRPVEARAEAGGPSPDPHGYMPLLTWYVPSQDDANVYDFVGAERDRRPADMAGQRPGSVSRPKPRVYELAAEFNVDSKAVMDELKQMGEFVRSASSVVEHPVAQSSGNSSIRRRIADPVPPVSWPRPIPTDRAQRGWLAEMAEIPLDTAAGCRTARWSSRIGGGSGEPRREVSSLGPRLGRGSRQNPALPVRSWRALTTEIPTTPRHRPSSAA